MTQRLFLLQPDTVFAARVNQTSFAYPLAEVTFDGVTTGAFGDIQPDMTVLFGTTAGDDDLGRQRIRKAADGSKIYIGESSENVHDGEVDLQDDAHITVLDDYRVWARLPRIEITNPDGVATVTHYKDYDIAVGTKTTNPPPVANIGPGAGFAGDIDGVTSMLGVDLVGTDSLPVAAGASISTYSWDVGSDGTITSGAGTSSITATFPRGFRWVRLTVTDSNGNSHTTVYPVYARDPDSDTTIPVQIVEHAVARQGQRLGIRPLQDVPESTYPDGTLVMVWEGEPATPDDRDHMRFVGWHHTDPSVIEAGRTATLPETTLVCLDAAGKLDTLPAFPQSVEHNASPSTWQEMAGLNADLMFHYMLQWHSTFLKVANWRWTGTGNTYEHIRFDMEGASLWDQVAELSRKLEPDYHFTFSRQGEARMIVDPVLVDAGSRTATVQDTITESMWQRLEYEHQRPPRVHWRRAGAIVADSTGENTVFCVAPGEAPGQGEVEEEDNIGLAPSQTVLNATEGHRYARLNAPQTPFTILLSSGNNLGIEPADMTWLQLTMSATTAARRGLAFTDERGLPLELNISYDHGREATLKSIEIVWQRETEGNPAVTYIPPDDEIVDDGDDLPLPDPDPDPSGFGTLIAMVDGALDRTRNLSNASPSYSGSDLGPGGGMTYDDLKLDPYDPGNTAYVGGDDGLYKSTDFLNDSPTWTQVLSPADINTATGKTFAGRMYIELSIHQQDYVAVFYAASDDAYCAFSEDGGSTWTHALITGDFSSLSGFAGADVADRSGGFTNIVYMAHNTSGGRRLFKSTDKGASWSLAGTMAGASAGASLSVHCPYTDNTAADIVFVGLSTGGWVTEDGGSNFTALPDGTDTKGGIFTYTEDRQRVFHWRTDDTFWVSTDGGSTWTQKNASGLSGAVKVAGGFPNNPDIHYALTDSGIFLSKDGGDTFADKSGDWAHGFSISTIGGTIVPLWTE